MTRILKVILLCLLTWLDCSSLMADEKPFVVVISAHNNTKWYKKNLESVFSQNYNNYRIVYVDDGSTDGVDQRVRDYIQTAHQGSRVSFFRNEQQHGPLACITQSVFSCNPDEIIVELDGTDWLAHQEVLSYLNAVYSAPEVWMTYGQFIYYPEAMEGFASPIPYEVITNNQFRQLGGCVTHLRTFYAGLFQKINKRDLLIDGYFYPRASDLAYTIPMLEMAGVHSRFIPDILYVFNYTGAVQAEKAPSRIEKDIDHHIRHLPRYQPLTEPPQKRNMPQAGLGVTYQQLTNLLDPTIDDYQFLQHYLLTGKRENIERLGNMESGLRHIRLIGHTSQEKPIEGIIHVNSEESDRENCILLYSTFNKNYPNALQRLLNFLKDSDFKGHILYRIGGWPNTEGGSLVLSHIPYAFKVSFFKEAERRGYKRILWLDTAVVPVASMNDIFDMIRNKGYFVMGNSHYVGPYMTAETAAYFGMTLVQTYQVPSCSAGLFGIDLSQKIGRTLLDSWHRAAFDKDAFFSSRSDQNALSMILYQNQLKDLTDISRMPHAENGDPIQADSLFYLDRLYASGVSDKLPDCLVEKQKKIKRIYISPGYWGELFSINNPVFNRDGCLDVLYQLREKAKSQGYEVVQADRLDKLEDFEYLVVFEVLPEQLPILAQYPKEKLILFLWEPPSVIAENYHLTNHDLFSKVYTWHDGLVDSEKYFKFHYPVMKPMIADPVSFDQKKLCTLIACNKESGYPGELYSERRQLIEFFENLDTNDFTLFGKWWPAFKNYGGPIDIKVDVMKHFRFCFAYENIRNVPGYITEKIFDCFHAGTVPVYWGASNIQDTVPSNCYIARTDFADNATLYEFLRNMNEDTYLQYIDNIRNFLLSSSAAPYTKEHFIDFFMDLIKITHDIEAL